jgi:tyrosine aminotransferase
VKEKERGVTHLWQVRIQIEQLDVKDDVDFTQQLLTEENVFVLPGTIFGAPNYVRLVICPPKDKLQIACDRLAAFCARHRKQEVVEKEK